MRCLIAGPAKSGTTALLYAVAQAMEQGTAQKAGQPPALYFEKRIAGMASLPQHVAAKLILEHEEPAALRDFAAGFDRRILLVRDPRDNLVSRLLYAVASQPVLLGDAAYLRMFAMLLQRKQQAPASVTLQQLPPMGQPSQFLADACAANRALVAFAEAPGADWFVLRYEDLVAGRLHALSDYLGLPVHAGTPIDPRYQRVERTKRAGDWRHWFTGSDVAHYQPLLGPDMAALGYADDWALAEPQQILPEHSWQYFERLVHERHQHYGLAPLVLPTPGDHNPDTRLRLSKGDIINRLIRQFGFKSYLEYNKFDGASFYPDIVCASKTLAFLPEHSYLDATNTQRLLRIAAEASPEDILPLPELLQRYAGQRFDVIFFDPVHIRPQVDHTLHALLTLLNPGGVLVVHDCNPEREELASLTRRHGQWVGETYKAFALLRHHNPGRAICVSEDFGVGLIWNQDLQLDYALDADISYPQYAARREAYVGLLSYQRFLEKTERGSIEALFSGSAPAVPVRFQARQAQPAPRMECQLFWRRPGQGFVEANTASQPIVLDGSLQALHFALPPGAAGVEHLRFDVADGRVALRLATVELLNPHGALMWRWDPACASTQGWYDVQFCATDDSVGSGSTGSGGLLLTTSDDPQFHPALPASVRRQLGPGWVFQVAMAPQPPLVATLLTTLARSRAALADAEQRLRQAMPGSDGGSQANGAGGTIA